MTEPSATIENEAARGYLEEGSALSHVIGNKAVASTRPGGRSADIPRSISVVVIGGGQAGLSVGHYLSRREIPFVILDEHQRVGDAWRNRWDSLRLFTPARYDGLPGMRFPGRSGHYPTKDELADYLETYASRFELPIRTGTKVTRVRQHDEGFEVLYQGGRIIAGKVIVATGAYHQPNIPSFARLLDQNVAQMHSTQYQRPSQLKGGDVLVVGAGNSGAEIALDLTDRHHRVWLSGPDTGQEPTKAGTLPDRLLVPIMWFMASQVTKVTTPIGRKVRDHFLHPPRGIPLGRVRRKDLIAAGIQRVPRTTGVRDGMPVLENGQAIDVSNVIWCTGFSADFKWIDMPIFDAFGYPDHDRGIVNSVPGLYFVGLPFQYSLSSILVGGVGRDAAYVVGHVADTRRGGRAAER